LETEDGAEGGTKASSKPLKARHSAKTSTNVLERANDWQVQFDLELGSTASPKRAKAFPSEIAVVSGEGSCPDGVVWSMETKTVIMLELTSPWDENLGKRHKQKMEKYNQLVIDLEQGKHNGIEWNAQLLCVEIGARGTLHEMAWGRMCSTFGISKKTRKALRDVMQDAAIQCSHFIFLCRYHKVWDPQALRDTWVPPQRDRPTLPKTDSAASCGENNENVLEELVSSSSNEGDISAGMCK
jgi:hypothetical protein